MNNDNFVQLCEFLASIDLFGTRPPPPPWLQRNGQSKDIRSLIEAGRPNIPLAFESTFIAPLESQLARLVAASARDTTFIETLGGAVYGHAPGYELTAQLRRFLAVISDLYRSFLDRKKRVAADFPLRETLSPLATFKYRGDHGPFTIPVDAVEQFIGGAAGVVSLPAVYADHPVLWAALAHETGGHDVVHADEGLVAELQQGLGAALSETTVPGFSSDQLIALWSYWMDEAVADVYGLFNVGPAFVPNLTAFFSALRSKPEAGGFTVPKVSMRSVSPAGTSLDVHPTDILRIHLGMGVIDSFAALNAAQREDYIGAYKELSALCASGDGVELSGTVALEGSDTIEISAVLPLADMQEAARRVGRFIATTRLNALGAHCVQEIETWDDGDETHATVIRDALAAGRPIAALGDDAQLLAGATLRLLDAPDTYAAVTAALVSGLDQSFATDPIWGVPAAEPIFVRQSPAAIAAPTSAEEPPGEAPRRGRRK
jgi:hypothetical protein